MDVPRSEGPMIYPPHVCPFFQSLSPVPHVCPFFQSLSPVPHIDFSEFLLEIRLLFNSENGGARVFEKNFVRGFIGLKGPKYAQNDVFQVL